MKIPQPSLLLSNVFFTDSVKLTRAWSIEWFFLNPNVKNKEYYVLQENYKVVCT